MKKIASVREKFSYASCAVVYEFECMLVMSYLILFCTDVLQIDVTVLGIVMVLVKILDAVTDVIVLNLADSLDTKWGKYRPWILFAGIPLIVCLVLIFWLPGFLQSDLSKIISVCILYTLMVPIFETCFLCPMQVLGTVMSPDEGDRLDFATFRTVGENFSDFFISSLCMTVVLAFGSYKDIAGWRIMILIFAGIMLVALIFGFTGIKERVPITTSKEDGSKLRFTDKLQILNGKHVFFRLLISLVGMMIAWMASIALFSYYCIYVIGHEEWVAPLSTAGIVFQLITSVVISRLGRRIDKRFFIIGGGALLVIAGLLLLLSPSLGGAIAYQLVRGAGIGMVYVCIWAIWPDVADYVQFKSGLMVPGIIMAVVSLVMKIATAAANYLVTFILNISHYDGALEVQSAETNHILSLSLTLVLVVGGVLIMLGMIRSGELSMKNLKRYKAGI